MSLQVAQGLGFAEIAAPAKDDAQTVMNLLGEALNIPADQLHVATGSIKLQVLNMVKELNADLIIIGRHTPSHLPALLGSTALAVVSHAPCAVLTLR